MVTLKINGNDHTVDAPADMPLLWVLRDLLAMTGTKFGCGAALCGACTVYVDGSPRRSCVMPVSSAVGHAITTIEGISATPSGRRIQQAWLDLEVVQCGYCQSGQIMAAAALLAKIPAPTDTDIDQAMSGNICRCGTYTRIRAAIKSAARAASVSVLLLLAAFSSSAAAQTTRSTQFDPVASVVMHARCMNCHQDNSPRQTDAAILHQPLVVRGKDGHGAPTQQCQACHQATNTADGFVPGVATWRLAPLSMKWQGLTKTQICQEMKDPARNGGRRSGKQVIEHMKSDPLVLWAWAPGAHRTTPPLSHEEFVKALQAWLAAGMPCPRTG
ncbi:MAG TPA: (2Fe-2S)-binding protein [Gemmatimonadaceae bacterium]|nr:(2Fe-2S)-binding protein [Gemmatimonadaceae bacterium]